LESARGRRTEHNAPQHSSDKLKVDTLEQLVVQWHVNFSTQNYEINMKAIRHFFRCKARPELHSPLDLKTRIRLMSKSLDLHRPRVLVRPYLRSRFPNAGSERWNHHRRLSAPDETITRYQKMTYSIGQIGHRCPALSFTASYEAFTLRAKRNLVIGMTNSPTMQQLKAASR
jgi:hypothetical protein